MNEISRKLNIINKNLKKKKIKVKKNQKLDLKNSANLSS
jgi:hypothetical protein